MANQYPVIAAGQRITSSLLNAMIPVVVRKPSTTARTNTTTLADDPDLTYVLAANSVYYVEFYIKYAGQMTSATGFKTAWTVPSGASGTRSAIGPGSAANDGSADNISMHSGIHGYTTAVGYGGRSNSDSNQLIVLESSVVNTSSQGACTLQWAQNTLNASHAASVFSDSFMRITQLG